MIKIHDDESLKLAFSETTLTYKQFHGDEMEKIAGEIADIADLWCPFDSEIWMIDGVRVYFYEDKPFNVPYIKIKRNYEYYCIWGEHFIWHFVLDGSKCYKCSVFDFAEDEIEYLFKINDDDCLALRKIKEYILSRKSEGKCNFSNGRIQTGKYRKIC